jgi:predicted AlkP superfamily pyrophosphatase or phosphodiesterase
MPTQSTSSPARTRILLIGIDGLRWDLCADSPAAPTLRAMAGEGHLMPMTMEVPTISGPGWSSILTGTTHSQHGVQDNTFIGHRLHHHPDLLARAYYQDQNTRTFAAAGWPPLVSPDDLGPVIHQRTEQQKAGLHTVVARDGEVHGYIRIDAEVADFARAAIASPDAPDVSFVYFCDVDDAGHIYGALTEEYQAALGRVDRHVAKLTHAVNARANEHGERWLIVVVADHGHRDEGGHGGDTPEERTSFILRWSPILPLSAWPDEVAPHELLDLILAERELVQ